MMKDMIDKRNERERIARSIIKYWNVNYIPRTQADSGMQKQTAEAENAQDQTMDPNMQEDYNKATNAYSGKYGQEKDLDEVTKDQIDKKNREENWVEELSLNDALDRLNERENYILKLRFFEGKTQMEVADEIHISQAQVSRLEKSALKSIRHYLSL